MLARVPANIQVRLLKPQAEEAVPHVYIVEETGKNSNPLIKILKKFSQGGIVSLFIGLGIYMSMRMIGLEFGSMETSMIVLFPAMLGLLSSFIVF